MRLGNKEGFTWQPPGARRMVTLHLSQRGLGALLRKLGGRHQALNSSKRWPHQAARRVKVWLTPPPTRPAPVVAPKAQLPETLP